eukprot:scaffold7969_cov138-Cylindrotheca_fusiformis.AAC.1
MSGYILATENEAVDPHSSAMKTKLTIRVPLPDANSLKSVRAKLTSDGTGIRLTTPTLSAAFQDSKHTNAINKQISQGGPPCAYTELSHSAFITGVAEKHIPETNDILLKFPIGKTYNNFHFNKKIGSQDPLSLEVKFFAIRVDSGITDSQGVDHGMPVFGAALEMALDTLGQRDKITKTKVASPDKAADLLKALNITGPRFPLLLGDSCPTPSNVLPTIQQLETSPGRQSTPKRAKQNEATALVLPALPSSEADEEVDLFERYILDHDAIDMEVNFQASTGHDVSPRSQAKKREFDIEDSKQKTLAPFVPLPPETEDERMNFEE